MFSIGFASIITVGQPEYKVRQDKFVRPGFLDIRVQRQGSSKLGCRNITRDQDIV
jgi:hypothetical protein